MHREYKGAETGCYLRIFLASALVVTGKTSASSARLPAIKRVEGLVSSSVSTFSAGLSPTAAGAMNLDEEVRLYTTSSEREKTENLATLYSIIVSLEYLERAYVRDSVTGKE